MDEAAFWAIVEEALQAAPADMDDRCEALKLRLLREVLQALWVRRNRIASSQPIRKSPQQLRRPR